MLTGELKCKVDSLWDIFWTGGLTNPLDIIEQMTYLMFLRDLDEADKGKTGRSILPNRTQTTLCPRWSELRKLPPEEMFTAMQETVFPFLRSLGGAAPYMGDAIFKLPTPAVLTRVADGLDAMYACVETGMDDKGDLYEYMLSKLSQSGINGQFRTPRHIIRMIVELMQPKPADAVCDPACGTAGFLVTAKTYLAEQYPGKQLPDRALCGYDTDRTMLRIAAMNLMTHGIAEPAVLYRDSLSAQNLDREQFDLILANPPFKGSLDIQAVSDDLLELYRTKKTELLFLNLFQRMLKNGGRCACIVPDGVLFGVSPAHKAVRKELLEHNRVDAVISMPSGVFRPYTGVSTGILIFTKGGCTDKVWFYDMTADGYSLDDRRTAVRENDIPDITARFHNLSEEKDRERTEKSFFVSMEEITENGYDLSVNKYKKRKYTPAAYPLAREILTQLQTIRREITDGLQELEDML